MRNQKGITLIALTVTIVVSLILAVTSIVVTMGDNGVVNRAEDLSENVRETHEQSIDELNDVLYNLKEIMNQKDSNEIRIIQVGKQVWKDEKTTLKLKVVKGGYTAKGYEIEYQKDSVDGTWQKYENPIENLAYNDIILVRAMKDGNVVANSNSSITILDKNLPNAVVKINEETSTDEKIAIDVTLRDDESGIDISKCKWEYNKTNSQIGISNTSLYSNSFSTKEQTITLNIPSSEEKWYLHILLTDKAGNASETIEGPIAEQ